MNHRNHGDGNRSDVRVRRLLFRSWHRGTQESDLLLGSFADVSLPGLRTSSSTGSLLRAYSTFHAVGCRAHLNQGLVSIPPSRHRGTRKCSTTC